MKKALKASKVMLLLLSLLIASSYMVLNPLVSISSETVESSSGSGSSSGSTYTYTSRPTNYSFTPDVKASGPTRAYDGDNGTKAVWKYVNRYSTYGTSDGYFELTAYSPTAGTPRGSIITQINLSVVVRITSPSSVDATMNITFVVGASAPVVLQAPFRPSFEWYNRTWVDQVNFTEPNDGTWTWEDMSNLRFRFGRTDPGDADSGGTVYIHEVWATVKYKRPQLHVNPKLQTTQPLTITINATDIEELYGFEFKLYYNARVLTATSVTLGSFLNTTAGGSGNTFGSVLEIDDTLGFVWATQTIRGDRRGGRLNRTNGEWGVLATIYFDKDADGNSNFDLEAKLVGFNFVPVAFSYGEAVKKTYPIDYTLVQPIHDAAITSVVLSKTLIDVNETIDIDTTVINEGDYNETFDVTFHAWKKGWSMAIGSQTVSNLAPSASQPVSFPWDTTGFAGTYNLTAIAETLGPPAETNTTNNAFDHAKRNAVKFSVNIGIDVAVVNVDPNATVIWSGDPVDINVTVKNEGGTNITSFNVTTYADLTLLNTTTITDLNVSDTIWYIFTWNTAGLANGSYGIRSNATVLAGEKDGADNVGSGGTVYVGPDVAVVEGWVIATPTVVYAGDTVSINVTVKNEGARPATFDVEAWANTTSLGTLPVTNLASNANETKTFNWNTFGAANGTYTIWTNATILLGENDTADNTETSDDTVYIGPDVAVFSVEPYPTKIYNGTQVDISVEVKNEGAEPETFDVRVYVNQTSNGVTTQVNETQTVPDLENGTSTTLTFTWNTNFFANDTYLVFANATILVGETDTADNTKIDNTVYIGPDVAVVSVTPSPTGIYAGDPVEISVEVKNEGAGSETFDVTTFANSTQLNATSGLTLGAGVSTSFSFTWDTTSFANGTYIIWTNATELFGETDTADNNLTDGSVYIGPDIAVSGITYVSKTQVYQEETLTVRVKVLNEGGKETFDVNLLANSTLIMTLPVENLEGGRARSVTFTFTMNATTFARGNYWIKAEVPALPGETDTADNTYIYPDSMVRVKLLGDIDDNGVVDVYDTYLLGKAYDSQEAYRSTPRSPNWNPDADLNGDNFIILADLQALTDNYGKTG